MADYFWRCDGNCSGWHRYSNLHWDQRSKEVSIFYKTYLSFRKHKLENLQQIAQYIYIGRLLIWKIIYLPILMYPLETWQVLWVLFLPSKLTYKKYSLVYWHVVVNCILCTVSHLDCKLSKGLSSPMSLALSTEDGLKWGLNCDATWEWALRYVSNYYSLVTFLFG